MRTLFRPWPGSQTAAPWLLTEPAAGFLTYQIHQYSTDLEKQTENKSPMREKDNKVPQEKLTRVSAILKRYELINSKMITSIPLH